MKFRRRPSIRTFWEAPEEPEDTLADWVACALFEVVHHFDFQALADRLRSTT